MLDASAVLRFVDNEPGADRIRAILFDRSRGTCEIEISPDNWGEVVYILSKRPDPKPALQLAHRIFESGATSPAITVHQAERAGLLKLRYKLPYADAFAVELATGSDGRVLVTADFDFKPAEQEVRIEYLPAKTRP